MNRGPDDFIVAAFASCKTARLVALRAAVESSVPAESRLLVARRGIVSALCPLPVGVDRRRLAEDIRDKVTRAMLADGPVCIAASLPGKQSMARVLLLQAEQALRVSQALNGHGGVVLFEDLGPYRFVLGRPARDLRDLCDSVLGRLAGDERHDDLIRTLEAYLRSHGSVNSVARALYLHRNTVRARLRRIARITGHDLNDPDARLALRLALLGRDALARMAS